jgi:hypothetical protein
MVRRVSALSQVLKETQTAPAPLPEEIQKPQNDDTTLPQYDNTAKTQNKRKTDLRDKKTYYLEPGQIDKLEELRIAYRKATGKRLNEQDFMRLIVDRLQLQMLL